jgi:hypothetical protein
MQEKRSQLEDGSFSGFMEVTSDHGTCEATVMEYRKGLIV